MLPVSMKTARDVSEAQPTQVGAAIQAVAGDVVGVWLAGTVTERRP
jgi:hypothetical protein